MLGPLHEQQGQAESHGGGDSQPHVCGRPATARCSHLVVRHLHHTPSDSGGPGVAVPLFGPLGFRRVWNHGPLDPPQLCGHRKGEKLPS